MFYSDVLSNFTSNLSNIQNNIETIIKRNKPYIQNDDNVATVSIYRISMPIDYNKINTRFNNIYKKYSNHEQLEVGNLYKYRNRKGRKTRTRRNAFFT